MKKIDYVKKSLPLFYKDFDNFFAEICKMD